MENLGDKNTKMETNLFKALESLSLKQLSYY